MKNIFKTIIINVLISSAMPMQAGNSEMNVSVYDNGTFLLNFDGQSYGTANGAMNLTNVTSGLHHMQLLRMPVQQPGRCGMPIMLYDGYVNVPADSRISALVNNIRQLQFMSVVPLVQINIWPPFPGGFPGWGQGMNEADFRALKSSIESKPFDSSKLTIARQAVSSNYMTSRQISELMKLMTFESTKLDLAKYAYGYVIDRNNYYMVNDAFTFSSSIDELADYIGRR
ncbi:MAG: hypothetical protein Fur0041_10790 [Bacteroidia bacterium]